MDYLKRGNKARSDEKRGALTGAELEKEEEIKKGVEK